ncbi:hypothetical protein QUC31_012296 [Theobroma cacao]
MAILIDQPEFVLSEVEACIIVLILGLIKVKRMRKEYGKLNKVGMSIWECCELLNDVVDESDPDLDEPQIEHLLQTAEAIRKDYPDEDWLHLAGFVHDLGKVLLHPSFEGLPQWAVVGDTYPVGCAFDKSIVHHKVAKVNNTTWPPAALFIIRYHSFYALHRSEAYKHLMSEEDVENLQWLQIFNTKLTFSTYNCAANTILQQEQSPDRCRKVLPSKVKMVNPGSL